MGNGIPKKAKFFSILLLVMDAVLLASGALIIAVNWRTSFVKCVLGLFLVVFVPARYTLKWAFKGLDDEENGKPKQP